jgi:hypothetical protein
MSTHAQDSYAPATPRATAADNGQIAFAAIMMIVAGIWHGLSGLAGVLRDEVYVTTPRYIYQFDLTWWGWTHLVLGAVLVGTGIATAQGRSWGRVTGIALAILSLIANFLFLPHYPVWSILIIALDVAIIYSLATYTREA